MRGLPREGGGPLPEVRPGGDREVHPRGEGLLPPRVLRLRHLQEEHDQRPLRRRRQESGIEKKSMKTFYSK